MDALRTAYAYYRDSSAMQRAKGLSIPAQQLEVQRFATREGYAVVREFIDDGISGRSAEGRDAWQAMLRLVSGKKPVDAVLVWNSDRFARNLADASAFRALLADRGIRLLSVTEPNIEGPEQVILTAVLDAKNEMYSARLAQDTLRGAKIAASKGFAQGGVAPYGMKKVRIINEAGGSHVVYAPDEATAPYVTMIYEMYADGLTMIQIARELNRRGVPSMRQGRWSSNQVSNILIKHQLTYLGNVVYNRTKKAHGTTTAQRKERSEWIVASDAHEAIVSTDLVAQVNFRRSHLPTNRVVALNQQISKSMLFAGRVICGFCGHVFSTSWGGAKAGQPRRRYYSCARNRYASLKGLDEKCNENIWIAEADLDATVTEMAIRRIRSSQFFDDLAQALKEQHESTTTQYEQRHRALEEALKAQRQKQQRLLTAIMDGVIVADVARDAAENLEVQITSLERELLDLGEPEEPSELETMMSDRQRLQAVLRDDEQQRILAVALVERVTVWPDRLEVAYQLPLKVDVIKRPRPTRVKPQYKKLWEV